MFLEDRGVPTVTFVTEPFEGYARLRAKSLGRPGLPMVVFPHPLADLNAERIHELAHTKAPEVAAALSRT